jgi:hypothetical protein
MVFFFFFFEKMKVVVDHVVGDLLAEFGKKPVLIAKGF